MNGKANREHKGASEQARLVRFWRKYLRLTRAGVLVTKALEIIALEETDEAFCNTVTAIQGEIANGVRMSDALAKFPDEFSVAQLELVKVAEKRGAWDEVLQELVDGLLDGTFA